MIRYGKQVYLVYKVEYPKIIDEVIHMFEDSGFASLLTSKVSVMFMNKTVDFESSIIDTLKKLREINFEKSDVLELVIEFKNEIELIRIKKAGNKKINQYTIRNLGSLLC